MNSMISSHLTDEQLGDLVLNLAPSETESAHLESCSECELEVARLRNLAQIMQSDSLQDAPTYIIAAILRDFDAAQAHPQPPPSWGQRIVARLQMDSAKLSPSFGFRAGQTGAVRQLLFITGDGSLDLRLQPEDTKWVLSGQLLGQPLAGKAVLSGEGLQEERELSATAQFTFPPVPKGIYQLTLLTADREIAIPVLAIGE